MPEFFLVALVLVLVAALFILTPLMMNRSRQQSSRDGINVSVFKQRLAELEADRNNQDITEDEFLLLKTELERRLLEEASSSDATANGIQRSSLKLPLLLSLMTALIAWGVYQQIGAKADWEITQTLNDLRAKADAGEDIKIGRQHFLEQLMARLEQRPENTHYLMLVAGIQMDMENYPAATDAYQRLALIQPEDPAILAQYAQSLYLSSNRRLNAKIQSIADKALSLNPRQPTVLGLLGIASFESGEYQQAINYWQQLLPMLGPTSNNRQMITAGIEQAVARIIKSGGVVEGEVLASSSLAASLQLQVSMAAHLDVDANASVFIYARAVGGSKMPLAVVRLKTADLPTVVTLDDSMAMTAGSKLSNFEQVEVIARISKNGMTNRGPGDWEVIQGPIQLAEVNEPLTLVISEQVK